MFPLLLAILLTVQPPTTTAIVDVNVIPMDRETVLPNQTVIVRDGIIATIGPANAVKIPAGATRIDASDKYLLPGLADMHVHNWFRSEHALFLANGVTMLRSLWGNPQTKSWRDNPGDDVPNYYTAGAIVDGTPAIWPTSVATAKPEDAREAVRYQHENGYDFVKIYSRLARPEFEAIVDECKKRGIPFDGHVPIRIPLREVLASGMRCIEHLTGYDLAAQTKESPLTKQSLDEVADIPFTRLLGIKGRYIDPSQFAELARLTKKHNVWNCPTLIVKKNIVASPTTREQLLKRPEMKYVSPFIRQNWQRDHFAGFPDDQRAEIEASFEPSLALIKALQDADCDLLLGSDTPNPFVFPGFSVHEELQLMVEAGLTPYQALWTGTSNPARFLKQEQVFGMVKKGMRADLLLLDANPLDDIRNSTRIRGVMLRGTWFDRDKLDQMLADAARRYGPKEDG